MRKIVVHMSVSLDKFMEGPGHDLSWHLVDECRTYVHPMILGRGTPFLGPSDTRRPLRLAGSRTIGNGVVMLHHVRATQA